MSVLGTAAAVASFFIPGGQTGAFAMNAYGLGSAAENFLNPGQVEGPRLDDLSSQTSSYGLPIPFDYALNRQAGIVIWPSILTATEHKHEESGKGGGPDQVTFTYTMNMAVLVCEGPIVGIRRIWANKKLIFDFSATNSGATASWEFGSVLDGAKPAGIRIYLGTEDQEADTLITATDGPSPAYLGYAYVVFENYDVTDWGGRPPAFEFEVMTSGTRSAGRAPELLGEGGVSTVYLPGDSNSTVWTVTGTDLNIYDPVNKILLDTVVLPYAGKSITVVNNRVWVGFEEAGFSATALASAIDATTYTIVDSTKFGSGSAVQKFGTVVWNALLGLLYSFVNNGTGTGARWYKPADSTTGISGITVSGHVYHSCEMPDIQKLAVAGAGNWLVVASAATDTTLATITNTAWGGSVSAHRIQYDASRNCLYWACMGNVGVYKIDLTSYALTLHINVTVRSLHYNSQTDLIYVSNGSDFYAYSADGSLIASYSGYGVMNGFSLGSSVESGFPEYYFVSEQTSAPGEIWKIWVGDRITPNQILHSAIVSDICERADLSTSDINVTALTDLVDGYKIANQMTARAAIEPTLQAYNAAAVESDHKIKFVKLGGAIAATIPASDRAAHEFGSAIPDSLSITRAFELEIPNECDVEYPDVNADHLIGNQYARRITKETKQRINIQMPIVMSATKAKAIAETALYQSWLNQSFRWTTTRKYAYLEPTDPVYLTTDQATYGVRITKRRDQPNGVIEWEGRMEDPYTYTQDGSGAATVGYLPQTIVNPPETVLALIDCAMLRDEDDNAGFYVAMGGEL